MTTSVVEIIVSLQNLIEIILLLGLLYVLMQAFSRYQDRTAQALQSDTLTGLKTGFTLKLQARVSNKHSNMNNLAVSALSP